MRGFFGDSPALVGSALVVDDNGQGTPFFFAADIEEGLPGSVVLAGNGMMGGQGLGNGHGYGLSVFCAGSLEGVGGFIVGIDGGDGVQGDLDE